MEDEAVEWSSRLTFADRAAAITPGDTMFTGGGGVNAGNIRHSANFGVTSSPFNWFANAAVTIIEIDTTSGTIYAGTGKTIDGYGEGAGVYVSRDHGATWQQINEGLADLTVTDLLVHSSGTVLASTEEAGVYRRSAGGAWVLMGSELPLSRVLALAEGASGVVYAAGEGGVYQTTDALTTSVSDYHPQPTEFVLGNSYPNPFSTRTTIPFVLHEPAHVILRVYDILGREIVTLAGGVRPAGSYTEILDGSGLGSGVYIYRLHVDEYQAQIGTMHLLK